MLLSIDKVLQLISDGKDIAKIAELSGLSENDVKGVVEDARSLLLKYEKERVKKKIIIRKKSAHYDTPGRIEEGEIASDEEGLPSFLEGAELTAFPVGDILVINVAVAESDNMCGVAIIINDSNDRQVGKISYRLNRLTQKKALVKALSRSYEIAKYFKARTVKVRVNDETFMKQLNSEITVHDPDMRKIYEEFQAMIKDGGCNFVCESVSTQQNDKAVYLAQKALPVGR